MVSSDGPKEYEVAFEALAGVEQGTLQPGTVAYIGTGLYPNLKHGCVQISEIMQRCRGLKRLAGTEQGTLQPGTAAQKGRGDTVSTFIASVV